MNGISKFFLFLSIIFLFLFYLLLLILLFLFHLLELNLIMKNNILFMYIPHVYVVTSNKVLFHEKDTNSATFRTNILIIEVKLDI